MFRPGEMDEGGCFLLELTVPPKGVCSSLIKNACKVQVRADYFLGCQGGSAARPEQRVGPGLIDCTCRERDIQANASPAHTRLMIVP